MTITFQVAGDPQPKGSTKAYYIAKLGRARVTEDNRKSRPWAALVRDAATQVMPICDSCGGIVHVEDTPAECKVCGGSGLVVAFPRGVAVRLSIVFTMPRPASLPKRVVAPTKKPDLDKLARAVKDALTGVVWQDDSQVVELVARKRYACGAERPGARAEVRSIVAIETTAHGLFEDARTA